jgi:hypothetical protein
MTTPHEPPGAKHQLDGVDCGQERLNQSLMQQPQQRGDRLRLPLCWRGRAFPWWFLSGWLSTGAISRSLQAGELISTLTLMLQLGESGQRVEA